jgi:hypothetical protein
MRLACPTCRQSLDTPDTPGLKVVCPTCGQKILLPFPSKPAAQNPTVFASPEDSQPGATPAPLQPVTVPVSVVGPVTVPVSVVGPATRRPAASLRALAPWLIGSGIIAVVVILLLVFLNRPDGFEDGYHIQGSTVNGTTLKVNTSTGASKLIPVRGASIYIAPPAGAQPGAIGSYSGKLEQSFDGVNAWHLYLTDTRNGRWWVASENGPWLLLVHPGRPGLP